MANRVVGEVSGRLCVLAGPTRATSAFLGMLDISAATGAAKPE